MEEEKKYSSMPIPGRSETPYRDGAAPVSAGYAAPASTAAAKFAEIEIDPAPELITPGKNMQSLFPLASRPEPVGQKAYDPLRLKFYEMRRLASNRPFARDDSELFYRQAKFMEDFADDYDGDAKFFMYYPYYQHMGYEQLRTYFTWRAKVRNGDMPATSPTYVFLYVYELLHNIGVADPPDGLDKLLTVWNTCVKFAPALENYMPRWFKDYYIYYGLPQSFTDFAKAHDLIGYFSTQFLFDPENKENTPLWISLSGYDVTKSKFYNDGNEQLFNDCLRAVLDGIDELCARNNSDIAKLLFYGMGKRMPWHPFKQALFYSYRQQPDRAVELPGSERYYCRSNQWSACLPVYYSTQRDFVGYIIKKTEACLRETVKYKYKLSAESSGRTFGAFQELKAVEGGRKAFDEAIESAVGGFYRYLTRTVVTVDQANLARIRHEAEGTQAKLTVPEDAAGAGFPEPGGEASYPGQDRRAAPEISRGDPAGEGDEWAAFIQSLGPAELTALSMAARGSAGIKAFADDNGIMLEVLADGINDKAADFIGDSILETDDGMVVYEEYREKVRAMTE